MDIQIPFIFVSLFSLASVVLIFIYKFGIKEKSYEEALAEQRQQTHILLGIKPKLKEKKTKRPSKKGQLVGKEKPVVDDTTNTESDQTENGQKTVEPQKKPHVEFKEVPEEVSVKTTPTNKKQHKKDKVRPILIHKQTPEADSNKQLITEGISFTENHFEELHPKDDFELFRSVSADEGIKGEEKKNEDKKTLKVENDVLKPIHKKLVEIEPTAITPKEIPVPPIAATSVNGFIGNSGKEKKKKKSEFNSLQQLAGDTNGPNMSVLLNLIRKAELSRSEVQILIDLLLNKQHEAPADEWSEGKSDPVQKLKKQLAEKEKLLLEEQQVVASAQAKLKEIRSEHQNEKTLLLQKIRNIEEALQAKQLEINRTHQQLQKLQTQIKEELLINHKLKEDNAAMQMQRQQFELRLSQARDSEVIITQLQGEVQGLNSFNSELQMKLKHCNDENIKLKDHNQSFLVQMNNLTKELEQKTDRNRQLEETLERELDTFLKKEHDFKVEITQLNNIIQQQNEDKRRLEHTTKQYHDDLQKHREDSNKIINQLSADLRKIQEENLQIKMTHMNGSLQDPKQHEVEILNLHNELTSVKNELSQAENQHAKEIKAANALAEKLQKEIDDLKDKLEHETTKLTEQKNKNNELREKNWKVMEALNAAECRIKNNSSNVKSKTDEEVQREFIQRLFPEIKNNEILNAEVFKTEGENFIRRYIENLRKQEKNHSDQDVNQLHLQVQHYKTVIDNTEKILTKLQKHIEQEEIKWRMQLAAKTAELESLKEAHQQELKEKLAVLQAELKKEQEDKNRQQTHAQNSTVC